MLIGKFEVLVLGFFLLNEFYLKFENLLENKIEKLNLEKRVYCFRMNVFFIVRKLVSLLFAVLMICFFVVRII